MASRAQDWLDQARRDLDHARHDVESDYHEWACFSAHQSAEKALKALYQHLGGEAWGHSTKRLMEELSTHLDVTPDLVDAARILDRFYIPTRYPNGFDDGKPADYYIQKDSQQAIDCAETIVRFCARCISG